MIDEILKRTHYSSPDEYLEDRVKRDYEMVLKGKKINWPYYHCDRSFLPTAMRCKVTLYVAGKVFYEVVEARDYKEAKEAAVARNPNEKVVGVTAVCWVVDGQ